METPVSSATAYKEPSTENSREEASTLNEAVGAGIYVSY
jgi:hypothetical protein